MVRPVYPQVRTSPRCGPAPGAADTAAQCHNPKGSQRTYLARTAFGSGRGIGLRWIELGRALAGHDDAHSAHMAAAVPTAPDLQYLC